MAFTAARCKHCNEVIQVDIERKTGFCLYCGIRYITADVINNYYTAKATTEMTDEVKNKIKDAEISLTQFKNYQKAEQIFREVTEIAPRIYKGWWGIARSITQDFRFFELGLNEFKEIENYVEHALAVANNNEKDLICPRWDIYKFTHNEWIKYITNKQHPNK